ncbi:MAG: glycosyltransferase family 39 protein [Candidatus Uhrbacteria bacterium]
MVSETRRDFIILGAAGLFFFFSALCLSFVSPTYSSPDETANAFFSETLATQGRLFSFESLNAVFGDVLFPRSVVSVEARLLPISFLGLPVLLGSLSKIFGLRSLPIWTPFLAFLAILAWYAIVKKIFDRQIGLWSALLLMFFPAWWYWSARPLMHNVVFVCFLIFTVFFLVVRPIKFLKEKIGWLDFVLAGLFLGLAFWLRTFEVFWLGFSVFVSLIILRKYLTWQSVSLFFVSLVIAVVPLLLLNNSLYGGPFKTGYTVVGSAAMIDTDSVINLNNVSDQPADGATIMTTDGRSFFQTMLNVVAPFGLRPRTALQHLADYFLYMFWWLVIPAVIGLFFVWPRRTDKDERRVWCWNYLFLTTTTIIWLGLVYGSWFIFDNPDVKAITIGNSYTRYWLPIFVLITPLIAATIVRLTQWPMIKKFRVLISVFCFLLLFGGNVYAVFFSSADALWPMRQRLVQTATIHNRVLELTESNAVIVVDRADKLFFSDRRVRYPLRDETTYALLPQLALRAPLYYYGITLPEADLNYLNDEKLKALGLQIELVENFGQETLYKIFKQ